MGLLECDKGGTEIGVSDRVLWSFCVGFWSCIMNGCEDDDRYESGK